MRKIRNLVDVMVKKVIKSVDDSQLIEFLKYIEKINVKYRELYLLLCDLYGDCADKVDSKSLFPGVIDIALEILEICFDSRTSIKDHAYGLREIKSAISKRLWLTYGACCLFDKDGNHVANLQEGYVHHIRTW